MANLWFVLLPLLTISCDNTSESVWHSETENEPNQAAQEQTVFYVITSDFQDDKTTERKHLRLLSEQTGQSFIVPPAKYGHVQTASAIISGFKVEGENACVPIPESAFPLWVDVCETSNCTRVRRTGRVINPGHYSISGIGGLMLLQQNPLSPCSEEFTEQIKNVSEYVDANSTVP